MRLAERVARDTWALVPSWKEQLRALGDRGDILRQMHAAVRGDPARYRVLEQGQPLPRPDGTGRRRRTTLAGRSLGSGNASQGPRT
jgi:hypothetical protein